MDERNDDHLFWSYPIDKAVIPREQLTVLTVVELRNPAPSLGQCRERLGCIQEIANEPGGSRRRFVSQTASDLFK